MFFISVEDFFAKASTIVRLDRDEEEALALRMKAGDEVAREALVNNYLPLVASFLRRAPQNICTLSTIYACIVTTEKSVERFDRFCNSKLFARYLCLALRQCITRCIADSI